MSRGRVHPPDERPTAPGGNALKSDGDHGRMSIEGDGHHVVVYRATSRGEAREQALVLAAMGIGSRMSAGDDGGVVVSVAIHQAVRAQEQLLRYERENRMAPRTGVPMHPLADALTGTMIAGAFLVLLYVWSLQYAFFQDWVALGALQVGRMTQGEWWRAVTALGLHGDLGHLTGNLLFGAVFSLVLAQSLGTGLAWLGIVVAGAGGNMLNAAFQPAEHTAIGASTAVFAAVGILSGLSWKRQTLRWRRGLRRWTPVAAGLMLLVYLGLGGERTDIGAHVAGFVAGGALGIVLAYAHPWLPRSRRVQRLLGATAAVLFIGAWAMALTT